MLWCVLILVGIIASMVPIIKSARKNLDEDRRIIDACIGFTRGNESSMGTKVWYDRYPY